MSHRPPRGATGTRASGLLPWKRKGGPEAGQPRRLNRCPVCNHTKPLTASSEERSQFIEMTHFGKRLGPFPVPSSGHQSVHATSGLWQRKHSLLRKLLALRQGSANCSPGDHPGLLPICVNKVLLAQSQACSFAYCLRLLPQGCGSRQRVDKPSDPQTVTTGLSQKTSADP